MHNEFIALAIRKFDSPLDPAGHRALADHLASCEVCRAEVTTLREAHDALRSWGSERAPVPVPPSLQAPPSGAKWWPGLIAAGVAGLVIGAAGGFSAGRRDTSPAVMPAAVADGRTSFTLLLEEPAGSWPPVAPDMRPGYVDWRDSLASRGQLLTGQRFSADGGWYLARGGVSQPAESMTSTARGMVNYSGFFVIRARDYLEAVAIAQGSPHLQFGGILVRRTF
jgi:hypothetical protein